MPFRPTSEQIAGMLEQVRYEITHCFVVPEHDASDAHILRTIYLSVFIHARILLHFFETAKRREDDVLCTDFGFPAQRIDLAEDHRMRFKKDMMHLAYARLRHTSESKVWPIDEIGRPIGKRAYQFICHVVGHPPLGVTSEEVGRWSYMKHAFQNIG